MSTATSVENKKATMPYVRLGKSGLKVSKIILGCMSYGTDPTMPWVLGEDAGLEQIKYAYEAGINTFDTANTYSKGTSEIVLGNAIKKLNLPRDEIVVMTKVFFSVTKRDLGDGDDHSYVNQKGLSRKHIFDSVKHSLERLQLDYIDVLQCHRFDPETPLEETMQALHDVVQAGHVRYVGMSSCYAYQFHAMQNYAINNKLTPFISMQNHHSLVYREEEREMLPTLKLFGVGVIPWSPLAGGFLARPVADFDKTKRGQSFAAFKVFGEREANKTICGRVEELAKKKNKSMAQIALAWSLNKDGITAPIIGTTSLDNLKELIAAVDLKLDEEDIKYLEEPYEPQKVFGH